MTDEELNEKLGVLIHRETFTRADLRDIADMCEHEGNLMPLRGLATIAKPGTLSEAEEKHGRELAERLGLLTST